MKELQRELLAKFRADSKANKLDEKAFVDMMLLLMNLKRTEQSKTFAQRMFRFTHTHTHSFVLSRMLNEQICCSGSLMMTVGVL